MRICRFTVLAFMASSPALAGDVADLNILGFSADGHVFAFEEYGVQDGSGFPYANRFYIDTDADSFLSGTPVRVRIDDENATVAAARATAKAKGEKVIADAELFDNRGFSAGLNAVGELSADPNRIAVMPRPIFPSSDEPLEFRIEETQLAPAQECMGYNLAGLKVLRTRATQGGATQVLHDDAGHVPKTRGCATGYRIAAVQTAWPPSGTPAFALVIAVQQVGFEGPDFRYMAVTGRIDD